MSDTLGTAAVGRMRRGALQAGDAAYAASPALRPRKRRGRGRLRLEIALLTGPAIIVFVGLVIFPVALAAYYGFYRWHGYGAPTDRVGLGNYKLFLTDPDFHQVLLHNGMIVVLSLVIQGPLAVLLALLLNQKIRGRSVIRILIFVPFVISEVIAGTGWSLLKLTDSELMLAVNLGTRGILPALDLLEYANHPSGTALSDLRIANGTPEPHNVRMWCLGNEMDGPWQEGFMTADDYGKIAARTAAAMRMADKDLELVVCGSSGSGMPTFGDWERTVLEHSYEHVDYVSCHAYYQELDGDLGSFLASALDMDFFIDTVVATADHVGYKRRSKKKMQLSFDEWNVWYLKEHQEAAEVNDGWTYAPRQLEDVYSVADAVVVGNLLMTLLKHSDRVTSASLAQLVNVIAPIMTEPGGPVWRQTTFFPFSITSRLASGEVIRPVIEAPTYDTRHGKASVIDAVATVDDGVLTIELPPVSWTATALR